MAENILFALRCNRRVVEALTGASDFSEAALSSSVSQLPTITYEQFLATLVFSVPDNDTAQTIVDWINSSLYIEFIIVAAAIINDENLKVSDKIVNELAFLIADAAQEYSATATESGILKPRSTAQSFTHSTFDNKFIKEQKQLADLGLNDFDETFN